MSNGTEEAVSVGGMGSPTDYSWIGDIVEQAVMSQHQAAVIRNQVQRDPCGLAAYLRELMGTSQQDKLNAKWAAVRTKASFLPLTIEDSLERLGNTPPGSDLQGGKRLAEFLFETIGPQRLIPPQDLVGIGFLVGPLGPQAIAGAQVDWIEQRLPSGQSVASGAYLSQPSTGGTRVSSQIYIKDGQYRGIKIKRGIERWTRYQAENVSSPALANVRADLVRMVGDWKGSGRYGVWAEGDEIKEGSELGNLIFMWEDMERLSDEAQELCEDFNIGAQQRQDAALAGELAFRGEELAQERQALEAKIKRDQALTIGALFFGAVFLMRRKK